MFIATSLTIAKIWEKPECPPAYGWIVHMYICIYKLYKMYIYMERGREFRMLYSNEKAGNPAICSNINDLGKQCVR